MNSDMERIQMSYITNELNLDFASLLRDLVQLACQSSYVPSMGPLRLF